MPSVARKSQTDLGHNVSGSMWGASAIYRWLHGIGESPSHCKEPSSLLDSQTSLSSASRYIYSCHDAELTPSSSRSENFQAHLGQQPRQMHRESWRDGQRTRHDQTLSSPTAVNRDDRIFGASVPIHILPRSKNNQETPAQFTDDASDVAHHTGRVYSTLKDFVPLMTDASESDENDDFATKGQVVVPFDDHPNFAKGRDECSEQPSATPFEEDQEPNEGRLQPVFSGRTNPHVTTAESVRKAMDLAWGEMAHLPTASGPAQQYLIHISNRAGLNTEEESLATIDGSQPKVYTLPARRKDGAASPQTINKRQGHSEACAGEKKLCDDSASLEKKVEARESAKITQPDTLGHSEQNSLSTPISSMAGPLGVPEQWYKRGHEDEPNRPQSPPTRRLDQSWRR